MLNQLVYEGKHPQPGSACICKSITDPTYIHFSDEPLVALICVSTFVGQCHAV